MKTLSLLAVLAACGVAQTAFGQSMKPGLWEMQQKMQGNPELDQAMAEMRQQMASMPPEQRRQMEAMMAQRGVHLAPGNAMAVRMCMTREMVQRDEVPVQQGDCRTTQRQRSGNTLKMAFTCTQPPSRGESEVTFASPEAFASRTTVESTEGGRTERMTVEATGRWLGADCGSVKPVPSPAKK